VYRIDATQVETLRATVIITQSQCRICAVTADDLRSVCALLGNARVISVQPITLDDVFSDVRVIAEALGVPERGTLLEAKMRAQFAAIMPIVREAQRALLPPPPPPRIAHLEWLAPMMGSGYWIAECCELAGARMIAGSAGGSAPCIPLAELATADVILIAPCGFSIERSAQELIEIGLLEDPAWQALPAVRAGRVFVADGNLYFNRSSSGVVESAEIVAEISHDLAGLWGHHGKRWVHLSELEAFAAREGAPSVHKRIKLAHDGAGPAANGSASAAEPVAPPDIPADASAETVVAVQLAALRSGSVGAAYALCSPANRARLQSAERFAMILKMEPYCLLLEGSGWTAAPEPTTKGGTPGAAPVGEEAGDRVKVLVRVTHDDGAVGASRVFTFELALVPGDKCCEWRTDAVHPDQIC